mmetsp:Transcript_42936/g.167854  ORF Transcript_42936/g.167854 Transcript_42936/m.167854 type:complete len:144 (-) Transcript_42936:4470-4901(-)
MTLSMTAAVSNLLRSAWIRPRSFQDAKWEPRPGFREYLTSERTHMRSMELRVGSFPNEKSSPYPMEGSLDQATAIALSWRSLRTSQWVDNESSVDPVGLVLPLHILQKVPLAKLCTHAIEVSMAPVWTTPQVHGILIHHQALA